MLSKLSFRCFSSIRLKLLLKFIGLLLLLELLRHCINCARSNNRHYSLFFSKNVTNNVSISGKSPIKHIWIFDESQSISEFQILSRKENEPDCSNMFQMKPNAKRKKSAIEWTDRDALSDHQLFDNIKGNCDRFLESQKYFLNISKHKEEEDFKIAFTMLVFKSASQVERLLRTIYRPWNYYCIHVDNKSSLILFDTIEELTKCLNDKYNNIVNTNNRVDVKWGGYSLLIADLNCMKEVYDRYKDWKYLINLTGQEFPLKTNLEIVKIIKSYKGASDIDGSYKHRHEDRLPPKKMSFPVVWFKGEIHITANRAFVDFIFQSPKAQSIVDILKDRWTPDETLYSTLHYNPQFEIPGSYVGDPDENIPFGQNRPFFMTRYKNWGEYPCESKRVFRGICIWGVGDLSRLVRVPHLFTNKFYEDFQPATLRCMERFYYRKISKEIKIGDAYINASFYSSLPFVLKQLKRYY